MSYAVTVPDKRRLCLPLSSDRVRGVSNDLAHTNHRRFCDKISGAQLTGDDPWQMGVCLHKFDQLPTDPSSGSPMWLTKAGYGKLGPSGAHKGCTTCPAIAHQKLELGGAVH